MIGRVESSTGGGWQTARVLVDDTGRAAIWQGAGHENVLVWSGRATVEAKPDGSRLPGYGPWELAGADGQTFMVEKRGCGCGSRLSTLGAMDLARLDIPT